MFNKEQIIQEGQKFKTLGLGFTNVSFYRPVVGGGFELSAEEMVGLHDYYPNTTMTVRSIIVEGMEEVKDLYHVTKIGDGQVTEKHLTDAGLKKQEGKIVFSGSSTRVAKLDSKNR